MTFYKSLNKKMQMIVIKECFMTDMEERERERALINIQMPTVCISH